MPYRPEAELKRPDLKGEFVCATCLKTFCHAASLNRHRLNFHGGNHLCTICKEIIPSTAKDTVRRHMATHGFERIFTCGCCNWAFPDKKELHVHTSAMAKYNDPGAAQVIATTVSSTGEAPAVGCFKEPKKVREARQAAKAAATLSALISGAVSKKVKEESSSPVPSTPSSSTSIFGQSPSCLLTPKTEPSSSSSIRPLNPPFFPQGGGVLPPFVPSADLYMQLFAQLLQNPTNPLARTILMSSPLFGGAQSEILSSLASLAQPTEPATVTPLVLPQTAIPTLFSSSFPLSALDTGNHLGTSSGLPSSASASEEAHETESERAEEGTPSPPASGISLHSALMSLTARHEVSSEEGGSSPSSVESDEQNNNSGSQASPSPSPPFPLHSIASLISPSKELKPLTISPVSPSSSSSEEGATSFSPDPRSTPSPGERGKKRKTMSDVLSFLHAKQVKIEGAE